MAGIRIYEYVRFFEQQFERYHISVAKYTKLTPKIVVSPIQDHIPRKIPSVFTTRETLSPIISVHCIPFYLHFVCIGFCRFMGRIEVAKHRENQEM